MTQSSVQNGKPKLIVPIFLGLRRTSFVLEFSSRKIMKFTMIELIQQLWIHYLELGRQFTLFQATKGKTNRFYIRNGMLDTKKGSGQTKSKQEIWDFG